MNIKVKRRLTVFLFAVICLLTVTVGYYILKFPFGTNVFIDTSKIDDLYWNVDEENPRFSFTREKKSNKERLLRQLPRIEGGTSFDKVVFLADWVHKTLKFGKPEHDTNKNPFFLLDNSKKGNPVLCDEYAALFVSALDAYGFTGRIVHVSPYEKGGHFLSEVWIPSLDKWVMIDPLCNLYITLRKKPLSIREIYRLDKDEINDVKVHQGDIKYEQLKFDRKYFRNFDFYQYTILLRSDFISRPDSFMDLFFLQPQHFFRYKKNAKLKIPLSSRQIKKNRIKILFLSFCMLVVGFLASSVVKCKERN